MKTSSASLKIGTPEIRVGLNAVQPKSSMMKIKAVKGRPVFTNDASNPMIPKDAKRIMKMPKRIKK